MALPFEAQSMEERIQDRAKRARNRETWHRVTREDKLTYNMAAFIADEKDAREEAHRPRRGSRRSAQDVDGKLV
jgi:hypothetical protein